MRHGLLAGMATVALAGTVWTEEINVVEAGPHHRVMQVVREETDPSGEIKLVPHQWQELATGLNRWDDATQTYVPAEVQFEPLDTGHVIARKTAHQIILSPQLNDAEGAVELWGPDNLYLRSTIMGIGVVDSVTGTNYLLATIKEKAELEEVSDSEVLIRDAFDTLKCDLRYSIGLNRFEQDIIVREQLTPELLADLGINPLNARLFLMTEFFQPPQPQTKESAVATTSGKTLADTTLDFGSMSIGAGRAFSEEETPTPSAAEAAVQPSVGVGKEWKVLDGRQFLIETVQYEDLAPILEKLPILDQARADTIKDRVRHTASLPKAKTTRQAKAPRFEHGKLLLGETKVASTPRRSKGLAMSRMPGATIDYQALISQATLTLQGDWTAVLLGTVNVSTLLTIEGGTVVKVTNAPNASIVCSGSVVCQTDFTRMGVFSSVNDNTIGEKLPASTGNPWTNYCGSAGLELRTSGQNLHHLRFAHLQRGLFFSDTSAGTANTVSHSQFARCGTAVQANGYGNSSFANLNLRNVLIHDATNAIYGYSLTGRIEHLTAHRCTKLAWDYNGTNYGTTSTLYLTNSLLVNVSSNGNMTLNKLYTSTETSSNGVFQTVGAGGFYLAPTYSRGTGTTNINATLATELKSLTTYPPLVLNNVVVGTNTLIGSQVVRNTGLPDLGYHYSPIDVAAGLVTITNPATLTLPAGLRLATFGDAGLLLEDGGRLVAEGQAQNPIRIFRFNAVQEQSINWGNGLYEPNAILGPGHNPSNAPPVASLRFVWFDGTANYGYHLYTGSGFYVLSSLEVRDCQFRNGRARLSGTTSSAIALNNNLFERVNTYYFAAPQISAYNNLHWAGITLVQRYPGAGIWTFRDNAFHDTAFTDVNGGVTNGYNAFLGTGQGQFATTAGSNVVLTSFSYTNGPLGAYYQLSTNLINAGSRNATNAGLYHHTVLASQVKEANSTVDIGYHLIALNTQTEFEVPKAGMTADASSTYAGWYPAYAINGSTNDPGWHNTSTNEEPAWLRVNLGLAYPVTRVDYCPRAGATNGTYQDYKIYVCNNNSTSLGDWGAEAAAGHWDWPNGQERKSVALLSPCGQYVIFRRITGVKGYAQANEVWIYASTGTQGEPVDSNNDGLPDYLEDRNGDGVPDARGVADPWDGSQGTWSNYGYYPDGRLGTVYGARGETVGVDGEGNVTRNSQ